MDQMKGYQYNVIENTLTVTAWFQKRAGQVGTPEYKTVVQIRQDHPNVKVIRKKGSASACINAIRFADMEYYISLFPEERQDDLKKRLERTKALSKTHASPYKYVLDWFLDYFPCFNADPVFDEDGNAVNLKTKDDIDMDSQEDEMTKSLTHVKENECAAS